MDATGKAADVVAACRQAGAHFSSTTGMNPSIATAIADHAWIPIHYRNAIQDPDTDELLSDAEVAEIPRYTAFTGRRKAQQVTARLIAHRVKRLHAKAFPGQTELFTAYRYQAVFTDSPFELPQAEANHRRDAVIEQVIAEGKAGPWLTCPRGTSRPARPG